MSDLYVTALEEVSKVDPDISKVLALLNQAIDEGDGEASYALGTWYLHGHHIEKDPHRGAKLIEAASKGNHPAALFDMAVCYEKGVGKRKNLRLAAENYLKAALYGDIEAIYEVGRCFYHGIGFKKDKRVAKIWLNKAADKDQLEHV